MKSIKGNSHYSKLSDYFVELKKAVINDTHLSNIVNSLEKNVVSLMDESLEEKQKEFYKQLEVAKEWHKISLEGDVRKRTRMAEEFVKQRSRRGVG